MRHGDLILSAGRARSKKTKTRQEIKHEIPPHPKHATKTRTARRPLPPRDRARRDTSHALAHTRPLPEIARFQRSLVSESRPRTALVISINDECYTDTLTDTWTKRQTARQTNIIMAPCTHPVMKRLFVSEEKNDLDRFAPSDFPHY